MNLSETIADRQIDTLKFLLDRSVSPGGREVASLWLSREAERS